MKKTSSCKIVCSDYFYKFSPKHFLIKCVFLVFIFKNIIKNKKFDFFYQNMRNMYNILIFREFENFSVEKKTLSTVLGFEPKSFDCQSSRPAIEKLGLESQRSRKRLFSTERSKIFVSHSF